MSDTREYIIDQSYGLFLNHSYEAVSISEISKAIGLTKGALYHHFTNKEELFKAVIDKYLDIQLSNINDPNISLTAYIDKIISHAENILNSIISSSQKFITLNYLSLFIDAFRHYPGFSKEKESLIQNEIKKIEMIINNAIEKGEVRRDINTSVMAMNFFSLSMGMAANLIQNNSPKQAIEILREQLFELYRLMKV
jgi:TetR/AcrR family transcriptional regulator, transcriptional repressor for nem operon